MISYLRERLDEPRTKTISFRTTQEFKSKIDTYCKTKKITLSDFIEETITEKIEREGGRR